MRLWGAIQDYVSEIINIYYEDDEDVEKDEELANMIKDLKVNGYHHKVIESISWKTIPRTPPLPP